MLTKCEACKQVVEISYLNLHLLSKYIRILYIQIIFNNRKYSINKV